MVPADQLFSDKWFTKITLDLQIVWKFSKIDIRGCQWVNNHYKFFLFYPYCIIETIFNRLYLSEKSLKYLTTIRLQFSMIRVNHLRSWLSHKNTTKWINGWENYSVLGIWKILCCHLTWIKKYGDFLVG